MQLSWISGDLSLSTSQFSHFQIGLGQSPATFFSQLGLELRLGKHNLGSIVSDTWYSETKWVASLLSYISSSGSKIKKIRSNRDMRV
ncbi:hypothetical protein BpHYR1_038731 [Brachionus plicatilis]|uniref:Uncharacterized protein n=1 Tax=Brachionus plicatilis TaxID=10195 RepID=A0A3M7S9V1_BRAPC|nr:hypothetical protein BpHYR1_038731 [Brachionus plicatilis]